MRFIVHKERGVFLTADEAVSNLDAGQLEAFEEDFKSYSLNQGLRDSLHPFKVVKQFTSASDGAVTFESDYMHFLDGCYVIFGSTVNKVTFVGEDEKAEALTNQLRPISEYPIAEGTSDGFQLYPQQQRIGFYSYLRRPATPVLAFNQSGRTLTYNASGSTQLEWTDNYVNNIIARALAYSSVFMNEEGVLKFTQLKQAQTTT